MVWLHPRPSAAQDLWAFAESLLQCLKCVPDARNWLWEPLIASTGWTWASGWSQSVSVLGFLVPSPGLFFVLFCFLFILFVLFFAFVFHLCKGGMLYPPASSLGIVKVWWGRGSWFLPLLLPLESAALSPVLWENCP